MCDRFLELSSRANTNVFVVNLKFPRATYHTIVPSTEELYCSIRIWPYPLRVKNHVILFTMLLNGRAFV